MGIRGLWIFTTLLVFAGPNSGASEGQSQMRIGEKVAEACSAIGGNPLGPLCICQNPVNLRTVRERSIFTLVEPFKEGCNGRELGAEQAEMACRIREQGARLFAQASPAMRSLLQELDRKGMLNFKLEGIFSATSPLAALSGYREQIGQTIQRFTQPRAVARETLQEGYQNIMAAARSHVAAMARESLESHLPASLAAGAAMARQRAEEVGIGAEDLRAAAERRAEARNWRTQLRDLRDSVKELPRHARELPRQAREMAVEGFQMTWEAGKSGARALLRGGAWGVASLAAREGAKAYFGINLDALDPFLVVERVAVEAAGIRQSHASTPAGHYQRFPLHLLHQDISNQMACDLMKENPEMRAKLVAASFALEHLARVAAETPPESRQTEAFFCFTCRLTTRLVTH